jgi:hypothetical protein
LSSQPNLARDIAVFELTFGELKDGRIADRPDIQSSDVGAAEGRRRGGCPARITSPTPCVFSSMRWPTPCHFHAEAGGVRETAVNGRDRVDFGRAPVLAPTVRLRRKQPSVALDKP